MGPQNLYSQELCVPAFLGDPRRDVCVSLTDWVTLFQSIIFEEPWAGIWAWIV